MPRCEACGKEAGKDKTGEGRRFCAACTELLAAGDTSSVALRYVGCGHMVGHEDDGCKNCKRSLKSEGGLTYFPGVAGGMVLGKDKAVMIEPVEADELPRRG